MRLDKLTTKFQQALQEDASSLAVGHDNQMIEPQHLLLALLQQDDGGTSSLLAQAGTNVQALKVALDQAIELARSQGGLGAYALQAAIASCHAVARTADATDWQRIAALYDALAQRAPSPVVELNRAVALGMAFGPAAGLEVVDAICDEPQLRDYHLLPSVRGDLLYRLGRFDEARTEFERAASMTRNSRERALLTQRAEETSRRAAAARPRSCRPC